MNAPDRIDALNQRLQALPDPELPDALWDDVRRGRRSKHRNRLLGAGGVLSIAVVAATLLGTSTPLHQAPAAMVAASSQPTSTNPEADIRAIDAALQTAYARGLPDTDLSPLWLERERLMTLRETHARTRPAEGGQS